jgi:FdrA protein
VHLLGTDLDPQGFTRQADTLRQAGAETFASNAAAAQAARAEVCPA